MKRVVHVAALFLIAGCRATPPDAANGTDAAANANVSARARHSYARAVSCGEATDRLHRAAGAGGSPELMKEAERYMAAARASATTAGEILGMTPREIEAGLRDSHESPEAREQDAEFVRHYLTQPHGKFEGEQFLQHFLQPCDEK